MEKKKIMTILFLALFAIMLPLAIAEDEDLSTDEQDEVDDLRTPLGAEVRLLQLERSITRNIESGNEIIAYLTEQDVSANFTKLESIITELELLLEDVQAMDPEGDAKELALEFVEIKRQAIELSKEFRTEAVQYLSEEDAEQLRERIQERIQETLGDLDDTILEKRRQFNAERVGDIFGRLGINDTAVIERIRDGNLTLGEVRSHIVNAAKNMTGQQRAEAAQRINEERAKLNVFREAAAEKVKNEIQQRVQERLEENRERVQERINETRDRIQERLEERKEDMEERMNSTRERFEDRIENRDIKNKPPIPNNTDDTNETEEVDEE